MIRENLNTFYLKLTTLTPLHIGTGEVYTPTNFVIDNGKLFEFDEVLFYQSLNPSDKREFGQKLNNWMGIIDFYRSKVIEAKAVARFECEVSKKIENTYKKLRNDDGSKKKNQFQIAESFKNPNTHRVVIPGSSIKGMLDTVLGIYAKKVKSNEPRQRLILSDALLLEGKSEIGYAYRKHKNPTKTARSEIPQMVEIISLGSTFVLSIKTEYSFSKIQEMIKNYHNERRDSKYSQTANSFVARVGKFCGKEYMVDDGRNVLNSYDKPIATHTLYESGDAFGWVKIEQITKEMYDDSLESIALQEQNYYRKLEEKQKEILEKIAHQKEEQRALALAKAKREKEEAEAKAKKEAEEKAKLASMTPVQRLVESYSDVAVLINDMRAGQIEDFDSIKVELAQEVKKILQQSPKTWDKAKKKALDRKVYVEGLLK
jgi:hypothetical protein